VLLISFVFCVVILVGSVTLCCVYGGVRDSVLLIFLVFCVVFWVGFVTACCLSLYFSVLCFWWGPLLRVAHLFCFLCCIFGGVRDFVLLTFLVFCVVFLGGSVTPCCRSSVFGEICDSMLLISLVFCVVFVVGSVTACCSSLLFSVLCFWWGP
jgi:hypothetical protein